MGLRNWVKKLEHTARGNLESFELLDGSRYYHNPQSPKLFLHWSACLRAGNPEKWPEPPEAVRKVTQGKDPRAALKSIMGGGSWSVLPYDLEALVRERDIRPCSLVAGRGAYTTRT